MSLHSTETTSNCFENLLKEKKISEYLETDGIEVFLVSSDDSLDKVAKVLTEKNLKSIPVIDFTDNNYKVLGLIDFMDIATHILDSAPTTKELKNNEKKATEDAKEYLKSSKAIDVINKSGSNPFIPVTLKATFDDIITKLTLIHRVPVLNNE
jgi:predicted transcriptional regulator